MDIKIIVNPRAGDGKARETGFRVEKFLCDRGIEYSLETTYRPKGATSLAKKAIDDGFELIIAVGGDGTVNEVLNGMVGSTGTLAVIPAGIQNNFSRMLGLDPGDINAACEAALGKKTKKIDVGMINGTYFINGIGIGLNAEAGKKGKKGNYLKRLFSSLKKFKAPRLEINIGGVDFNARPLLAKIANGGYSGGSYNAVPHAVLDDGLLDICLLNDMPRHRAYFHLPRFLKGKHKKMFPLTTLKASEITIHSDDPFDVVYDGEIAERSSPYNITVAQDRIPVKIK